MSDPTWNLPSIERFFQSVADELEAGTIVVVHLAPHAPNGVASAMRRMISQGLRHKDLIELEWRKLRDDTMAGVVNKLASFALGIESCSISSVAELASLASHRVYCFDGVESADGTFWKFIEAFRLENHGRPEFDRDTFLILLDGNQSAPKFDVGLKVLRWEGVVREIDGLMYLSNRLSDGQMSQLHDLVKIRVLLELAGTDLGLLDYLSQFSLRDLVTPKQLLMAYSSTNSWLNANLRNWNDGGEDQFNSSRRIHSCCLALRNDDQEIFRRVWRGQLVSLFPYIEERRIELAKSLSRFVSQTSFTHHFTGETVDFWDLDIGPMCFIANKTQAPSRIKSELRVLRDVRHHLAHLQPVPCDQLEALVSFQSLQSIANR